MNCFKLCIFEVVQAKLFEHQIIENNLYNNGQRIRNCKLFYYTIFIMLSNNSFLSAKIRFLSNYKNILLKKLFLGYRKLHNNFVVILQHYNRANDLRSRLRITINSRLAIRVYGLSILLFFRKCHVLHPHVHQSVGRLVHDILFQGVRQRLLHFCNIYLFTFRKFLHLDIVYLSPVKCQYVTF